MAISVFDLFSVGIGPSSSHTVGPMRATRIFLLVLEEKGLFTQLYTVKVELFGSLALTGHGHGTDKAILLGLEGETPEGVDPGRIDECLQRIRSEKRLKVLGEHSISFDESKHLLFRKDKFLPYHANGMRFTAEDSGGRELLTKTFYSIGGGFIVDHEHAKRDDLSTDDTVTLPFSFQTASELLGIAGQQKITVSELMMRNEQVWRSEDEIKVGLLEIWKVMKGCIHRGCNSPGVLPGGLKVRRRAPDLFQRLQKPSEGDPAIVMDWLSLWALAVNEENAAGGRVVTAPTNGAAGIIPSVLQYYEKFCPGAGDEGVVTFLLTAGAIGILYKLGASISAAEMGCQGEVGVACSMAAAGLTAALGGSSPQIENAAEIGMEHNLGLTCDPVGGLVQIPCIERNTMGAVKAVNASRLALQGDGSHRVHLDQVIATMRQTGHDMQSIYKETSQGGLAVNVTEC